MTIFENLTREVDAMRMEGKMNLKKLALPVMIFFVLIQPAQADFVDNGDGTVTESLSKLMWQRCTAPSTEISCGSVAPSTYNWLSALSYCNNLSLAGYTDWRLPNVKSLHALYDAGKAAAPAINTAYFPDTQSDQYWSSTTFVDTTGMAWYVPFSIGLAMTSPVDKGSLLYVRCVRGG